MKICWIGIIGRANVGKSTLINKIINYDLSIISNKPQTTRDKILGIYNEEGYQLIFVDTPGIHKPQSKFNIQLNKKAYETLNEVDLILFLQPLNEKIQTGDLQIIENLKKYKNKIAVITKSDLSKNELDVLNKRNELKNLGFENIFVVSKDKEKLIFDLVEKIKSFSYESEQLYDEDYITDRSELFLSREIIRLSAIEFLDQELPHSIAIEINKYDINENETSRNIEATIYCKKESQKGIIVGKNGSMIKKIGTKARKAISEKFDTKVNLFLSVKVNKDWINNDKQMKKMGY